MREWSKAEIARIREETEARIALRKTALDGEMDQHGLVVESRVQQVGATVAEYEAQMDAFFERLRAEEDPTRIAAMAERMPEPPGPGRHRGRHRRARRPGAGCRRGGARRR